MIRFPEGFLWGAATSAYQIEGSPLADGAGPSIWHRFSHSTGRTANGETGDVACDHYRRYAEDVALMRELGLNSYRFSISWSRVLPHGRGRVNGAGLSFYHRRADAYMNRQYLDPLLHGCYPNELHDVFGDAWPDHPHSELEYLKQPIDFVGVNYYTRSVTRSDPSAWPVRARRVDQPRHAYTETGC